MAGVYIYTRIVSLYCRVIVVCVYSDDVYEIEGRIGRYYNFMCTSLLCDSAS